MSLLLYSIIRFLLLLVVHHLLLLLLLRKSMGWKTLLLLWKSLLLRRKVTLLWVGRRWISRRGTGGVIGLSLLSFLSFLGFSSELVPGEVAVEREGDGVAGVHCMGCYGVMGFGRGDWGRGR